MKNDFVDEKGHLGWWPFQFILVPAIGLEPMKPLACEASALPTELSGQSLFFRGRRMLTKRIHERQAEADCDSRDFEIVREEALLSKGYYDPADGSSGPAGCCGLTLTLSELASR
jgi:hypothetical protein